MSEVAKSLPSKEHIQECVEYNKESGILIWKTRPLKHFKNAHGMNTFNSKHAGNICGSKTSNGYVSVWLDGGRYLAHRVIWKLVTGVDPDGNIDHIDTNKRNNSWINLRIASKQENAFNQGKSPRNKTGFKGVSFDPARNKYYASICTGGKSISLGRHDTAELAHMAYCKAADIFHRDFARSK